ncbi:caspase-8-like isoform X2 [Sparus aurata]|uniref:caspase-8-like isoform X2 n=1 Tax=Sparus aurata TaxID=8175 RepID=UPI0011C0CFA8|nr:caspase-8-like isoform X2 [Sparus aurata]
MQYESGDKKYIMYYGTTKQNAEAILRSGFCQSEDGVLGRGVYLHRELQKASRCPIDQPESDWAVLKVSVKVGRVKAITQQGHPLRKTWHDYGYDTAWMPPNCGMGTSGLEEDCVWDPDRIQIIEIINPHPVQPSFMAAKDTVRPNKTAIQKKIQLTTTGLSTPVQASSAEHSALFPSGGLSQEKRCKEDDQYQLNSRPTGLCVIINNENFTYMNQRRGTNRDAQSLGEVFSWLGFRVLMCKDQTRDQMDQALKCFASLSDLSQLPEFSVQDSSENGFTDIKEAPPSLNHGDAFICCIMSHGESGVVSGSDGKSLPIKHITRTFKATDQSALTGKPKVFLIQACQGKQDHRGVLSEDLQADDCQSQYIPEEADFLVAIATVEDYKSFRHTKDGSWFIQSVCQQLKEGCSRGDDMTTILSRVNNEVSNKEGVMQQPGKIKQMSEVRFTLRKRLVLTPHRELGDCAPIRERVFYK